MTFSASVYRRHGGRHRLVVVKLTTAPFSQHSPETDVEGPCAGGGGARSDLNVCCRRARRDNLPLRLPQVDSVSTDDPFTVGPEEAIANATTRDWLDKSAVDGPLRRPTEPA